MLGTTQMKVADAVWSCRKETKSNEPDLRSFFCFDQQYRPKINEKGEFFFNFSSSAARCAKKIASSNDNFGYGCSTLLFTNRGFTCTESKVDLEPVLHKGPDRNLGKGKEMHAANLF